MQSQLSGTHQRTYERLFQHPMPQNLEWREVWSMLVAIPDMQADQDHNGNVKASRNGETLVLHRPRGKDFADKEELMQLRHFLDQSQTPTSPPAAAGTHLLVVIDHHEARIFSAELRGTTPHRITPYDPFGFGRELRYDQTDGTGRRQPEQKSFYESIAKTLQNAQQILLFGAGTGASSAMEQLIADLNKHHHDIAKRIVGSVKIDEHHLTDDELLAKARELFSPV